MLSLSPSRCVLAAALLLSVLAVPHAAWAATLKLCMKDGTYQIVASYEVQGDRVRYFSVERSEWEEVPASLVDFEATKRAQEEAKATEKKRVEEAKQIDQERFYKPPDQGMEVAPGIRLPGDDGIFTVEGHRLVRLVQSTSELVTDKKRAAMVLAVPLPIVKTRSLVVLDGAKAPIRLNDPLPVFYVQSADGLGRETRIGAPETWERVASRRGSGNQPREKWQSHGRAHHGVVGAQAGGAQHLCPETSSTPGGGGVRAGRGRRR